MSSDQHTYYASSLDYCTCNPLQEQMHIPRSQTRDLGAEVDRLSAKPLCDVCQDTMEPEHAHYKCPSCSYILPCCGW